MALTEALKNAAELTQPDNADDTWKKIAPEDALTRAEVMMSEAENFLRGTGYIPRLVEICIRKDITSARDYLRHTQKWLEASEVIPDMRIYTEKDSLGCPHSVETPKVTLSLLGSKVPEQVKSSFPTQIERFRDLCQTALERTNRPVYRDYLMGINSEEHTIEQLDF